jgi:response regulator RpfG family c-di-GMP phosphodiesterase
MSQSAAKKKEEPAPVKRPRGILVVDPDPEFHDMVRKDPRSQNVPPLLAKTGRDAQLLLADSSRLFVAVVINPATRDPGGISVIRAAHQHRPATPIYVIHEGEPPFAEPELRRLGVQRSLKKPMTYAQIVDVVAPSLYFDTGAVLDAAKKNPDALDAELTAGDVEFVGIRAEDFLAGSKTLFDVYVRLSSGRYVKILQAGDAFAPERVMQYLKKGVTHFYLRKEVQQHYLNYCDKLATALLSAEKAPQELRISQTLNHGEQTLSFLRTQGLSEANLEYASNFVRNVQTLVEQLEPNKNKILADFMKEVSSYDHGVGTSVVAGLLMSSVQIGAESPVQILGLAAMLHDIGLVGMPPNVRSEDETAMNDEEKKLYRTHPLKGAEILRKIPRIHPTVVQAVAQHHERRTKKGFPGQIGIGSMNRVAEVVGIADEYIQLVGRAQTNPKIDVKAEMEKEIFNGFSFQIVEAFRAVFFFPESL